MHPSVLDAKIPVFFLPLRFSLSLSPSLFYSFSPYFANVEFLSTPLASSPLRFAATCRRVTLKWFILFIKFAFEATRAHSRLAWIESRDRIQANDVGVSFGGGDSSVLESYTEQASLLLTEEGSQRSRMGINFRLFYFTSTIVTIVFVLDVTSMRKR